MTRLDPYIDYAPINPNERQNIANSNWNLGFVNDTRFNVLPEDSPSTDIRRFPFSARWTGNLAPFGNEGELRITYVGEGSVTLGTDVIDLSPSYQKPSTYVAPVPPDATSFAIDFSFGSNDGLTNNPDPFPYAALKVESRQSLTSDWTLLEPRQLDISTRSIGLTIDLFQFGLIISLALAGRRIRHPVSNPILVQSIVITGASLLTFLAGTKTSLPLWLLALPLGAVLMVALRIRSEVARLLLVALGVTVAFIVAHSLFPSWTYVDFKTRGDDWLTYEHFARQILINRSLEGGEEVFYYQPGFRYILFAIHLVFGDGAAGVAFTLTLALAGSILFFVQKIHERSSQRFTQNIWLLSSAFGVAGLLLVLSPSIIRLISWHASEIPAWALMIIAFALMISRPTSNRLVLISCCAGAMFVIRPNQLFASLIIVSVSLAIVHRNSFSKMRLLHGIWPFVLVSMLPVIHNLYFGRSLKVLPAGSETVRDLSLGQLFFFPWTDPTREVLFEKFTRFFNPTMLTGAQGELTARLIVLIWPLLIFGGLWILGVRRYLDRSSSRWVLFGVLLVPLGFVPTMVLYDVDIYYPRHVVSFVLGLGLSGLAALVLANGQDDPLNGDDPQQASKQPAPLDD
ncbi:MAG: hypothetical protein O2801_09920 [Actinomycetota bacterium]|nr:hypothetical protein [Actinomycetota bacterium]